MLNFGETVDLLNGKYSVHDVASVFKLYLQELPEPLLTDAHFPIYIQLSGNFLDFSRFLNKNLGVLIVSILKDSFMKICLGVKSLPRKIVRFV